MDPSRAHYTALCDLIDAALDYAHYRGKVTDPDDALTYPYLVSWPPPAQRTLTALAGKSSNLMTSIQVTAVGRDVDEVVAALDRVAAAVVGAQPVISGRSCGRIEDESPGQPPEQSDVTRTPDGQPVYRGYGIYKLSST